MVEGEKTYSKAGNVRAPSKLLCLQWVKESWDSITSDIIVKSFRACGISVNTDGTNDGEIHCMKENEVAFAAREKLQLLFFNHSNRKWRGPLLICMRMKEKMRMNLSVVKLSLKLTADNNNV